MVENAAEDWPTRVNRLEQEIAGLRRAMRTRGLIEQAKGVLAERLGCDPEAAFGHLSRLSQETNIPLVDVAADILNTIAPPHAPQEEPEDELPAVSSTAPLDSLRAAASAPPVRIVTGLATSAATTWPPRISRALRRAISALNAARNIDELSVAALSGLMEHGGVGVAVFATDPNRALRLLGSGGWSPQQIIDARRIPAQIATPLSEVIRQARPVVIDGTGEHDLAMIGPGTAVVGYPVTSGNRAVGVVLFSWTQPRAFSALDRGYLDQLAKATGRALAGLWSTGVADTPAALSGDLRWIHRVIDGTSGRTQLLTPIRDASGAVVDFTIEAMSPAALQDTPDAIGRRLLDVYPQLVSNGVFDGYVRALTDGRPWERDALPEQAQVGGDWQRVIKDRRAAPIGGALIASWRRLDEVERLRQQVGRMEKVGRLGWCEWDPIGKRMWWSPGVYRLLRRDPRKGPLSRKALVELAEPEFRSQFAEALRRASHGGHTELEIDLRRPTPDGAEETIRLRVLVEHEGAHHDEAAVSPAGEGVRVVLQDVSTEQQLDEQLRRTQAQASAQRIRLAAEHELTRELMDLVYPARTVDQTSGSLRAIGRHVASDLSSSLRGDFCDAYVMPDGDLLVVVGDVSGAGLAAAAAVARLLPPVPVMGTAGLAPDAILRMLNAELHRTPSPPLAGMVLARIDHDTKVMTWAQASRLPPILLRAKGSSKTMTAEPLKSTEDFALGVTPEKAYTCGTQQLLPGDQVVFYTDGLFDRKARDPIRNLANRVGRLAVPGEPESALRLPTPAHTDEACLVVVSYQD